MAEEDELSSHSLSSDDTPLENLNRLRLANLRRRQRLTELDLLAKIYLEDIFGIGF